MTNGSVEARTAGARYDPTFLIGDVEAVVTCRPDNIDRGKLEKLIHRIFSPVRPEIEIEDRFGNPVTPREWSLVPFSVIGEAVGKIRDGTIVRHAYNLDTASLAERP